MEFNSSPPTVMHVDLNSCFASVEQQANPLLRGKPIVVAAYTTGGGCILAASREAKVLGVATGMRVREGKALCPSLIVLPSDPEKYRFINHKLVALLSSYTSDFLVKSIDEMVLNFSNGYHMIKIAKEIKQRIKAEIGEWLTVSIGIAPNRYLAKVASGLHKPDGLDVIDGQNIENVLGSMKLEDLCGIKEGYGRRLRAAGINTPLEFFQKDALALKRAFGSVVGFSWWMRLHGYEEEDAASARQSADYGEPQQKTFGQSYAFSKPYTPEEAGLHQVLTQLIAKMGRRIRAVGFTAGGIHISCLFSDHMYWNHGAKQSVALFSDRDFYCAAKTLLLQSPVKPVRILAVGAFLLSKTEHHQQSFFDTDTAKIQLTEALDAIHNRWGDFVVTPARMLGMEHKVLDRIAFGGVK